MDYRDYRKKYGSTHPAQNSRGGNAAGGTGRPAGGTQPSSGQSAYRPAGSSAPQQRSGYRAVLMGEDSRQEHTDTKKQQSKTGTRETVGYVNRKRSKARPMGNKDSASARMILFAIVFMTVLLISIIAVLITTNVAGRLPSYIASKVTVEAGRSSVTANDFLVDKTYSAEFTSGTTYSLSHVGSYKIKLTVDGNTYRTTLKVVDTVAPTGDAVPATVRVGGTVKAASCVSNLKDATNVTVTFKKSPDLSAIGTVPVTVILRDEGGNETLLESEVIVVENAAIVNSVQIIECGAAVPDVSAFVGGDGQGYYITDVSTINTSVPGYNTLSIRVGSGEYEVTLIAKDTVAPTATVTPQCIYNGVGFPSASSFVSNIVDAGAVSVSYVDNYTNTGIFPIQVSIKLTDTSGNSTVYDSYITAETDYTAPVITLLKDMIDYNIGDTAITWRTAVRVSDNSGRECSLALDTSSATLTRAGKYIVSVLAVDPAGNESRKDIVLNVHDNTVTQDMLDAAVKALTDEIFTDNMNILEKLKALYTYLSANEVGKLKYVNSSSHDDWMREAYLALTTRRSGDCFAYAAVSHAVFKYMGYDSIIIERSKEYQDIGTHFWNMINLGTAENPSWYHFDATPQRSDFRIAAYALTDAQVDAYTKWRDAKITPAPHYYMYDKDSYPASNTQIIVKVSTPSVYYQ